MGPTASGKTALAVTLVGKFPVDIISVDSVLVYRGMDIGTARPDAETLKKAPHRLIDFCEPSEAYSVARFRQDALREIDTIHSNGRVPLLVGGTMLYFRALLVGLSKLPAADPDIRAELEQEAEERGWAAMHEDLRKLDPGAAERINPNDPQRIQRALEVYRISGQSISSLQAIEDKQAPQFNTLKLVVCPAQRAELHRRIERRFTMMIEDGFVEEVKCLRSISGLNSELPSMRAVGYRQVWQWLDGDLADDEWMAKAIAATRQLAKRQLTWIRREKQALWYDLDEEGATEKVLRVVRDFIELHK